MQPTQPASCTVLTPKYLAEPISIAVEQIEATSLGSEDNKEVPYKLRFYELTTDIKTVQPSKTNAIHSSTGGKRDLEVTILTSSATNLPEPREDKSVSSKKTDTSTPVLVTVILVMLNALKNVTSCVLVLVEES